MKSILKLSAIATVFLASFQTTQAQLVDRIVAVVNDDVVLQSEFEGEFRNVIARMRAQSAGQQLPPQDQIAQQVLEQLIVERIQTQRAERFGIQIPDAMVNQMLQNIAQRNGVAVTQLPSQLASEGIDYADFREDLRQQIASQQLMQREIGREINITDSEIDRVLDQGQNNKSFKLRHILVAVNSDAPSDTTAKKQAEVEKLRERIVAGEDFSKLAIAYSNGNNALQGGDLGWRETNQIPSLFVESVNQLDKGQTSQVIRSPSGFHLIQVEDVRTGSAQELPEQIVEQYQVRHILLQDDPLRTDAEMEAQLKEVREKILAGEDFSTLAQKSSEDPGSATQGGELGWASPDTYAPAFAKTVRETPRGVISEPFRSQFGWHILEVTDQRQHNAANDMLRERARQALTEQKFEEESLLWRQRIRDEAYVDYRL